MSVPGGSVFLPVIAHPAYEVDIGLHVFPTAKYRLVRERLLARNDVHPDEPIEPEPATNEQILTTHTKAYVEKILDDKLTYEDVMRLEVPFSPELREAAWLCAGGTILTARKALEYGVAVHLGGGFHHAFPGHGEGFCLINDVAIATNVLRKEGAVRRVAIVDLDVHQGNGTAAIFTEVPDVYTFSMHQQNNYPAWKPASDADIGLPDRIDDVSYLTLLGDRMRHIVAEHRPELVFYLAGADPYREDQLGGLGLTIEGLRERDDIVLALCGRAGIPVAITLAGGYAANTADTVEIHCGTVRAARKAREAWEAAKRA